MNETNAWPFLRGIVHRADKIHFSRTAARQKSKTPSRQTRGLWNSCCSDESASLLLHRRRFISVLLRKSLHAAGGIHQLLLAGEERMAVRANFHADHLTLECGARVKLVAAGAMHLNNVIIGMDSFFHGAPRGEPVCASAWNKAAHSRR